MSLPPQRGVGASGVLGEVVSWLLVVVDASRRRAGMAPTAPIDTFPQGE